MAQIPKSQGIDLEKWIYMFDNVGIGFINSFEEGQGKLGQGKVSNFNQFTTADMSLSASVGQYISILAKIEGIVDDLIGISPQREGAISSSETASGVERSVTQSSHITEPWFFIHDEIKKRVLQAVIDTSKYAYSGSKKIHYMTDDLERITTEMDMDKFSDSDYGVFVTNSSKEAKVFQKLEGLSSQALSSGAATFSDVIRMFKATSVAELTKEIDTSEKKKQAQEQQAQQEQLKAQQEQVQSIEAQQAKQLDFEFAKMDHESMENEKDRTSKEKIAMIGQSNNGPTDTTISDNISIGKQLLDEEKATQQFESDRERLLNEGDKNRNEQRNKEREFDLREKEMKSKEKIEDAKNRTALKNKVSGEK